MRRALGTTGLIALALGLALGTAGTVAGQQGQTGYDDAEVLGASEELPEGSFLFALDLTGDGDDFGDDIPPGSFLDITADGFGPDTKGTIEITSERRTLAFVTADDNGVIEQRVQIPEDMEEGKHEIQVIGVDADGEERIVRIGVTVGTGDGGGSNWAAWTAGSIAAALAIVGYVYWRQGAKGRMEETAGAR